jgi:hypothetical protein
MSDKTRRDRHDDHVLNRRNILLGSTSLAAASALPSAAPMRVAQAQPSPAPSGGGKPNILVIFGDDIGQSDISAYTFGLMGYHTPNIDRIAKEGMMFTGYPNADDWLRGSGRPYRHSVLSGAPVFLL